VLIEFPLDKDKIQSRSQDLASHDRIIRDLPVDRENQILNPGRDTHLDLSIIRPNSPAHLTSPTTNGEMLMHRSISCQRCLVPAHLSKDCTNQFQVHIML
jgi:hypothetical protein